MKEGVDWSAWRSANYEFFKLHLAPLSKDKRLIDLGAGPVQFRDIFMKFDYIGVDFEKYPDVSVITDLTKDFPFEDGEADIVALSNTLEHIPTPQQFLAECKRILRPGGLLIGTVPWMLGMHQIPHDYNRYTSFQLERMLREVGFSKIEVKPLGGLLDVYNTMELKTFDALRNVRKGLLLEAVRGVRRLEMRMLRHLYRGLPAIAKLTEGFGFSAKAESTGQP